jgi:transcriptional antiterminator NusG
MEDNKEETYLSIEEKIKSHPDSEWYIIHTLSGMEEDVKNDIEVKAKVLGLQNKIFRLVIPVEKEIKIKSGKQKEVKKKIFPGYVFIEMILDDQTWSFVKSIQGVTGFVGPQNKPTPLTYEEVMKIRPFIEGNVFAKQVEFNVGDRVKITSGPFVESEGIIEKIYPDKYKAVVSIIIFGRETPIEVYLTECEKI